MSKSLEMDGDHRYVVRNSGCSFSDSYMKIESFEAALELSGVKDSARPFRAIFIRAPVSHFTFNVDRA